MKNSLTFTLLLLATSFGLHAAQQKQLPKNVQNKFSRVLKRLDAAEDLTPSLEQEARETVRLLENFHARDEIQRINKRLNTLHIVTPEQPLLAQEYTIDHTLDADLLRATAENQLDVVRNLLHQNVRPDINARTGGLTLLMAAANNGSFEMFELLLYLGADLYAQDANGRTVEDYLFPSRDNYFPRYHTRTSAEEAKRFGRIIAEYRKNRQIALTAAEITPQFVQETMETVSPGSSAQGNVSTLVAEYAQVNPEETKAAEEEHATPELKQAKTLVEQLSKEKTRKEDLTRWLMWAMRRRDPVQVKSLLEQGADFSMRIHGETAWELAFNESYCGVPPYRPQIIEIRKLLKDAKAQRLYGQERPRAQQEVAKQFFSEDVEEPDITEIISEYAYGSPEDLPKKSSGCIIS